MSMIRRLAGWLDAAKTSKFGLWKLNFVMLRVIPFNQPHAFRIERLEDNEVSVYIPYKRRNLNHLKGIHACAIATAAEYSSGILLLSRLSSAKYRIIMKRISVEYHYQGKMSCRALFKIDEQVLQQEVIEKLKTADAVMRDFQVEVHDEKNNHIATAVMQWQLKSWGKVKTV